MNFKKRGVSDLIKRSEINGRTEVDPIRVLTLVLAAEALLSLVDLLKFPGMHFITEGLSHFIPVVAKFSSDTTSGANIASFISVTCLLMPLKVWATYSIVNRFSPMDKALVIAFPSSSATAARKIFGFILVLSLNIGLGWYVFVSYGESEYFLSSNLPASTTAKYHSVLSGGLKMWFGWSVMHLIVMSFLIGLLLTFFRDWLQSSIDPRETKE